MGEEVEGGEKEEGGRREASLGHFPRGATGFGPPGKVVQKGPKMVTMSAYGGGICKWLTRIWGNLERNFGKK